mgnify:CR=1 FL=1
MEKFESTEALLSWIVDFFAQKFGNSAILKGGMSLRLMHSPRYTNDVDYIFVPFDSKKDAKSLVEGALSRVEGLRFESTMNSKALRILVEYGGQQAQIEINTEKECRSHTKLPHGTSANWRAIYTMSISTSRYSRLCHEWTFYSCA